MLLAKSALSAALCATLLTGLSPALFFQDAGPGRADDIAELLPADTTVFIELSNVSKLNKDGKEYLAAICTPKGRESLFGKLEEAEKPALSKIPEKLQKDLEKGAPSIQRVGAAFVGVDGTDIRWAAIATSSDEGFFKRVVEEDLRVFAGEEKEHQGFKVLAINKVADIEMPVTVFIAAAGKRLVLSTSWTAICGVLDRAVGKGQGPDLRQNAMYRRFTTSTEAEPVLRGFASYDWKQLMEAGGGMGMGFGGRRRSVNETDTARAIVDFEKIRGTVVEATFRPGRIAAQTKVVIDTPCRLYDLVRQPAGPKETLKYLPADTQAAAHVNLKGGKELWPDILSIIRRVDEIEKKKHPERDANEQEFREGLDRELGLTPEEIADAVGREAAGAVVGAEVFESPQTLELSYLVAVHLADPAKGKAVLEKLIGRLTGYAPAAQEGDATLYLAQAGDGDRPHFAIHGSMWLMAGRAETLKASIKSAKDGGPFAKTLPKDLAGASQMLTVSHRAIWKLVNMAARGQVPDVAEDLNLDGWSTLTVRSDKDQCVMSSTDVGLAMIFHAVNLVTPVSVIGASAVMMRMRSGGPVPVATPREVPTDGPPMAKEKLAEGVKKGVEGLRSEDLEIREASSAALTLLGRQAIPLVVEAFKQETDAEARERIRKILIDWRAFDALPELLKSKAESFVAAFERLVAGDDPDNSFRSGGFANWPRYDEDSFPWGLEPWQVNLEMLKMIDHADVLESPAGMKAVAELASAQPQPALQRQLAAVLAFVDCSGASQAVLSAHQAAGDPETKTFLRVALGWSDSPKAREIVLKGLKDQDRFLQRASFLAAERSRDPAVVGRLIELLEDPDHETQWNASYVLRILTKDAVSVNVYKPSEEVKAGVAAAKKWWEENGATFKIAR